jgi:hypothetical protein
MTLALRQNPRSRLSNAATPFYYDQRMRKEGFDIEWMMQSAGMTEANAPAVAGESAAPEDASVPVEEAGA